MDDAGDMPWAACAEPEVKDRPDTSFGTWLGLACDGDVKLDCLEPTRLPDGVTAGLDAAALRTEGNSIMLK
jgi:hypothetical protein